MARIAFVLIHLILAVAGRQTNSALLSAQENDGSMSLVNTLDDASASIIQPNERDLLRRDSESGVSNAATSGMRPQTQSCWSGYWSDGVCIPCPKGTYSKSGVNVCVPCEPGYYNNQEGQSQCTKCGQYDIAPFPGSTVCEWCPPEAYTLDNIVCIYRTEPTRRPTEPTSPPTESCDCTAGYYCNDIRCVPCRRGSYWKPYYPGYPYGYCTDCPAGTFSDEEASTRCTQCGQYDIAPFPGSTVCKWCPPMTYTLDNIVCIYRTEPTRRPTEPTSPPTCGYPTGPPTSPPVSCFPGSVNNGAGCVPCHSGTYEVAGSCVQCNSGTYSMMGSIRCSPCRGNYVAPRPGSGSCELCPETAYSIDGINCIFESPTRLPTVLPTPPSTRGFPITLPTSTSLPTKSPIRPPTLPPTKSQTNPPTRLPSHLPTNAPTNLPTRLPSRLPTKAPTNLPTRLPSRLPTKSQTNPPTRLPSHLPTKAPTNPPTRLPSRLPTKSQTNPPTRLPSHLPTKAPTNPPTRSPTHLPTKSPTNPPTRLPSKLPPSSPSCGKPTKKPSKAPKTRPTRRPRRLA